MRGCPLSDYKPPMTRIAFTLPLYTCLWSLLDKFLWNGIIFAGNEKKKSSSSAPRTDLTPAVGGSPTCKLICMYLHNSTCLIPWGPKALHHGGSNQSLSGGLGREMVKARDSVFEDSGSISFPLCSPHCPFLFHQETVVLSLLKIGFCLVVGILTPTMGHPGW